MSYIQNLLDNIINFFSSSFQLIYNALFGAFSILGFLPTIITNIHTGIGFLPTFLFPFAFICLSISVLFLVIDRSHG